MKASHLSVCRLFTAAATLALSTPAYAGSIPLGDWLQFSFGNTGVAAKGCDPADPAGDFCFPSSGTPTSFLDAPPWTFDSPVATVLTVTDAFLSGDRFSILDFGIAVGETSAPGQADCGDDPTVCLGTAGMSTAVLLLAPGSHSLTIVPTLSGGGGSGFLQAEAVPEPSTIVLLAGALASIAWLKRQKEVRQ
jgi:hypothetical protein